MKIAVVGGTGLVGRQVIKILLNKNIIQPQDITIYASKNSAGKTINIENADFLINALNKKNIKKFDYAFFCAGKVVAKEYAMHFVNKGAVVVDNSSAFRRDKSVPLVVPEINLHTALNKKLIANPNCSTIGVSLPLFCLTKLYKLKRVIVSTYQSVSGAGQQGLLDLKNGTQDKFAYKIQNNIIPQIDSALANGYTYEEDKMNFELKKILNDRFLKVSATCVRVPITNCHSVSVNIEFDTEPKISQIKKVLNEFAGIKLVDDLKNNQYPMPILADGTDDVFVGRVRRDTSNKYAINLFLSFDNIRKGAALNAVQIVEGLIKNNQM